MKKTLASKAVRSVPIGTIETNSGNLIEIGERKGSGASGVVYLGRYANDATNEVAVKFFLLEAQPSYMATTLAAWLAVSDKSVYNLEMAALKALEHPGIQRIDDHGEIPASENPKHKFNSEVNYRLAGPDVHFLVSKYIEGDALADWLRKLAAADKPQNATTRHKNRTLAIRCFVDLMDALTYLHEIKEHQHSDIRSDNIRIAQNTNRPVLIDFGFSQVFSSLGPHPNDKTRMPVLAMLNVPSEVLEKITKAVGEEGPMVSRDKLREAIFPTLDLYKFGKMLADLLKDKDGLPALLSELDRSFFGLIARELSDWDAASAVKSREIRNLFRKLTDGFWVASATPHLPQLSPGQIVRDIALPDRIFVAPQMVEQILQTASFHRLTKLRQLSLLEYVYRGATQSRSEHALAVYSGAVDLVNSLIRSPRFNRHFDLIDVGHFGAAALLHDINHFPFLHYCQELAVGREEQFDFFQYFLSDPIDESSKSINEILVANGLDPVVIHRILKFKYKDLSDHREQVIKSAIDSAIDLDKLAYVTGDARSTGVPFGLGVDRNQIIASADIVNIAEDREAPRWHLCFHPKAMSAVESLLMARYWNFKQVYWHHTNRAMGAMVAHVLRELSSQSGLTLEV